MLCISSGTNKRYFYGLFFEALETNKLFSVASFRTWNRAVDKYEWFNAASDKMQNRTEYQNAHFWILKQRSRNCNVKSKSMI